MWCRSSLLLLLGILWATSWLWAAGLEGFSGAITSARVTLNPASVALINRFHFQYEVAGYNTKDTELSGFTNRARLDNEEAFLVAPDTTNLIDAIEYSSGRVNTLNLAFVWPLDNLAFGIEYDFQGQFYKDAVFLDSDGTALSTILNPNTIEESIFRNTFAYSVGVVFPGLALGVRYNQRSILDQIKSYNPAEFVKASDFSDIRTSSDFTLEGSASYGFLEYGILMPNLVSNIDFGVMYRPETTATLEFNSSEISDLLPSGGTFEDVEFNEPALLSVGGGIVLDFETIGLQFLGEAGQYGENTSDAQGNTGDNGNRLGGLTRLLVGSWIDISYGVQEEKLAGFTIRSITTGLQLPIPALKGNTLKISTRTLQIDDQDGDRIVDATFVLLSFNLQFGTPRQRALEVAPKTKKITFLDRL